MSDDSKVARPRGAEPVYCWVEPKKEIVLITEQETVRAFSAICPHMGARLCVDGNNLVCPWHGLTFERATGKSDHPRYRCVSEYVVTAEGDHLKIGGVKAKE